MIFLYYENQIMQSSIMKSVCLFYTKEQCADCHLLTGVTSMGTSPE